MYVCMYVCMYKHLGSTMSVWRTGSQWQLKLLSRLWTEGIEVWKGLGVAEHRADNQKKGSSFSSGSRMPWLLLTLLFIAGIRSQDSFGNPPHWRISSGQQCNDVSSWRTGSGSPFDCSGPSGEGATEGGSMLLLSPFCMRAGFFCGILIAYKCFVRSAYLMMSLERPCCVCCACVSALSWMLWTEEGTIYFLLIRALQGACKLKSSEEVGPTAPTLMAIELLFAGVLWVMLCLGGVIATVGTLVCRLQGPGTTAGDPQGLTRASPHGGALPWMRPCPWHVLAKHASLLLACAHAEWLCILCSCKACITACLTQSDVWARRGIGSARQLARMVERVDGAESSSGEYVDVCLNSESGEEEAEATGAAEAGPPLGPPPPMPIQALQAISLQLSATIGQTLGRASPVGKC